MTGAEDVDDRNDPDANADDEDAGDEDVDRLFPESEPADGTSATDAESASDAPLDDLADRMRERRERSDEADDLFEEVDVGDVDEETLWKQVATDEGFVTEPPVDREDVVEKSAYCEKCEFFTAPPRTRCTHEGTTILELVDVDHFRVRNCPIVVEEEALENSND
ncbi:MAG: hypothetical protein ACOCS7_00875 [Halolamina sp.]